MSSIKMNPSEKPVILMVIGGLGGGGKEQQLISLLKGLKERNKYSVVLVAMNPNGSREDEARQYVDQLIVIKRIIPFAFFYPLVQVVRIARRFKVSLIHSWGSGIWDLLSLCVSRWLNIPFLHGGIRAAPDSLNFNDRINQWCANHADAIVANSKAGLTAFRQESNTKAKVIYNGLDLSRFEGIATEQIQYDLCMVANFSNKKDHQTLVNAMAIVTKHFPQVKLLLVGHDSGTLVQTRSLVDQLGLNNSVVFVTDSLRPYQYISDSKIGVLATNQEKHGEGISNAILEYLYFAKPVIATDNGGNSEVIIPGRNGYLVNNNSAEEIAERIIVLLENPNLAEQLGSNAKELVINVFGVEKMIDSFESVYSGLI